MAILDYLPQEESPEPAQEPRWVTEFWAAKPAYSKAFASEVVERIRSFYEQLERRGLIWKYRKAYAAYHGTRNAQSTTMQVSYDGMQGEFADIEINNFRNLVKHQLNLATAQRPAFDIRASNSDHRSAAQVKLARDAIDNYQRDTDTEQELKKCAEYSVVLGEGYLHQYWDVHAMVQGPGGEMLGDIRHRALTPLDVPHDLASKKRSDGKWWCVRDFASRYDLAATYPEKGEEILAISSSMVEHQKYQLVVYETEAERQDQVPLYYFYHARTPALPMGRHAILAGDVIMYDGPLPYDDVPIIPMVPSDYLGEAVGYADAWDLLGPAEVYNGIFSAIVTRLSAFGVNNVVCEEGGDVDVTDLSGMNLIRYPRGTRPPEVLDLLVLPRELFEAAGLTNELLQTLSGINSVARGDPDANIKSGAAMALVQAMAIQFNSGLQGAWVRLLERFATGIVRVLKRFVEEPRLLSIAGEANRWTVQAFKGEDLSVIDRVTISVGNPLASTTAGRQELAHDLLNVPGAIQTGEQYLSVLTTGRLDAIMDGPAAILEGIKAENETLARGEPVSPFVFERHDLHMREHMVLLNTPEAKANPRLVQVVTEHLMATLQMWSDATLNTPQILAVTGTPPLPLPGMQPGMPGEEPGDGQQKGGKAPYSPRKGGPGPDGNAPPSKHGERPTGMPGMPSPPTNPLTGKPAEVDLPGPAGA